MTTFLLETQPPLEQIAQNAGAVVLLSGGLDSAVALSTAQSWGYHCHALSFHYGQRHARELECAKQITAHLQISHTIINLGVLASACASALTDMSQDIPKDRTLAEMGTDIPLSYVPGRNILFLSYAAALAEALEYGTIFCGVHSVDYSGYPDCRPEFLEAFAAALNQGMASGYGASKGQSSLWIAAPLLRWDKTQIVRQGLDLGVRFDMTNSCYDPVAGRPCRRCDSCILRTEAFAKCGLVDPLLRDIPAE